MINHFLRYGFKEIKQFKKELAEFYEVIVNHEVIKSEGISQAAMAGITGLVFRRYPAMFKEMIRGISETSGLTTDKAALLEGLVVVPFAIATESFKCSVIAAWGNYASGGPLVIGRNFDLPPFFKSFARFVTLVIFKPDDGSIPTASVDLVLFLDAFHMISDRAALLGEMHRILKPNGVLFMEPGHMDHGEARAAVERTRLFKLVKVKGRNHIFRSLKV